MPHDADVGGDQTASSACDLFVPRSSAEVSAIIFLMERLNIMHYPLSHAAHFSAVDTHDFSFCRSALLSDQTSSLHCEGGLSCHLVFQH